MSNRKQQKATEMADVPEVNTQTGLTPIQEQAAILLASGDSFTAVAEKVSVNRSTLYKWQMQITFQCFFNQQCNDYKNNLKNGLFGLANEALSAIRDCLHSDNEATRLKAAMWVTDKVELSEIGKSDVREAVKDKHITSSLNDWGDFSNFDEKGYKTELRLSLIHI